MISENMTGGMLTLLAIGSFGRKRGTSVLFIVVGWAHVWMYRVSTIVFLWMYSIESHGVCSLICHLVISGNSRSVGDDVFGTFVLLQPCASTHCCSWDLHIWWSHATIFCLVCMPQMSACSCINSSVGTELSKFHLLVFVLILCPWFENI
jgi:hypothetical protein